jgi:hypothetical protein
MHKLLQMSNLGGFNYYLDIEVIQEEDRIMVRQSSYAIPVGGWDAVIPAMFPWKAD